MARPRKTDTGFVKVQGAGEAVVADTPVADTPVVEQAAVPEPVTVEIVEPEIVEPELSEQTKLEMEEGRRSIERYR